MIFLVSCTVRAVEYMQSGYEEFERVLLVDCETEDQAELIATSNWEDKSEYHSGTTYSVCINYVYPMLTWGKQE